jgi:outer membrane immunogenic protein
MRRFISTFCASVFIVAVSGSAFAADMAVKMPVKAPPPAPAPVYNWTGWILPTDRLLIYATGGLAYGEVKTNANYVNGSGLTISQGIVPSDNSSVLCLVGTTCIAGGGSQTSAGWTLGGGLEWAFANNWSIKAEYLYLDLGSQTIHSINTPPPGPFVPGSIATHFNDAAYNIVRVGLNYQFH